MKRNKNSEIDAQADLGNLAQNVDGDSIDLAGFMSLLGESDASHSVITGLDLPNGFSRAGDAVFDIGGAQNASNTVYEIKAGHDVPIPAALPLFATALAGIRCAGWRKKKAACRPRW